MAVPSAVKARAEREAAELAAHGIDPNTSTPPGLQREPFSTPAGESAAPTTPSSEGAPQSVEQLQAEIRELRQKISTHDGRVSATAQDNEQLRKTLEAVQSNREFLEGKLTEAVEQLGQTQGRVKELETKTTADAADGVLADLERTRDLTPQEIAEFSEESVEFVNILVRKQLATALKPYAARIQAMEQALGRLKEIDGKLPAIEQGMQQTAKERALARQEKWVTDELIPQFPDFRDVRKSKDWVDYLATKTQTGQTVGQYLATQYDLGNPGGARTIIKAYYDKRESKPNLDSLATPATTRTDAGTPREQKPRFKESEYRTKLNAFTQRRLAKSDWEAYKKLFAEAERDNRVDYGV